MSKHQNDPEVIDPPIQQRTVKAGSTPPPKTTAASSVFDAGRKAKAAYKRPPVDLAGIVIRKNVQKPLALFKRKSAYQSLIDRMVPGDMVELPAWMLHLAELLHNSSEMNFTALERAVADEGKLGIDWVKKLDTEGLARLSIVLLLCTSVYDESWANSKNAKGDEANALALEIGFDLKLVRSDIAEEVNAAIRDEIAELTDVVKPDPAKPAAKKAKAPAKAAPAPTATAQAKLAPLTPIQALEAAFDKSAAAEAPAAPVKVTTKRASKSIVLPAAAAPKNTLSPEAAWPFAQGKSA